MQWNSNNITDHNRSELSMDYERIEKKQRLANGFLRSYFIANKLNFSVSWDDVPGDAQHTVDGFWGRNEMKDFYEETRGAFVLRLHDRSFAIYNVMFTSFDSRLKKRGPSYSLWSISAGFEQV